MENKFYNELRKFKKADDTKSVELEKIELALADDIKKASDKLKSAIKQNGFDAQKKIVQKAKQKAKDTLKDANTEIFDMRREATKYTNTLVPLLEKYIVASKDLGVENIMNTPIFKEANNLLEMADMESDLTDKLRDGLNKPIQAL